MHPAVAALYTGTLQFTVGLLFATWLCDWRGEVTPGFMRLAALTALCGALLAIPLGGGAVGPERTLVLAIAALSFIVFVQHWLAGGRARLMLGALTWLLGSAALVLGASARPSPIVGFGWTALASLLSATALGTSIGALVLGHWYLVTPRLTARPLKLLCDLVIVSLVALTGYAGWYVVVHPELVVLGPRDPVLLWIGLIAIGVFPIGTTVAARICCQEWPRGRAIQAATGLLYVVATLVLAGALAGNMVLLTGPA